MWFINFKDIVVLTMSIFSVVAIDNTVAEAKTFTDNVLEEGQKYFVEFASAFRRLADGKRRIRIYPPGAR